MFFGNFYFKFSNVFFKKLRKLRFLRYPLYRSYSIDIPCEPLPELSNGKIIYNTVPTEIYKSATFICNDSTILTALSSTEAYCSSNGTWIYNHQLPPKCVPIPKEVQENIKNVEKNFLEQVI